MIYRCENCGKEFKRKKSRVERVEHMYCSYDCKYKHTVTLTIQRYEKKLGVDNLGVWLREKYIDEKQTIRKIMALCNTKSNRTIAKLLDYYEIEKRYGSEAVKTQWIDNEERRKQNSIRTKEQFNSKENREKLKAIMQTDDYKEKSRIAKLGKNNPMYGVIGENNPLWNPNKTHEQRVKERKTYENAQWRNAVFERDDYICQCCNQKGGALVAHHLYSYDIYEDKRYDIDNGIVLCEKCHKQFHSDYGYGHNTTEQFESFIESRKTE